MRLRFLTIVCLLLGVAAGTLASEAHWTVNPRAYQYDMTAYVSVSPGLQSGYEVGAFCGDECRGIGKLLTADDGTQVFQLRVWSNEATGEVVTFRVWSVTEAQEYLAEETIAFAAQTVAGTPSEPLVLATNAYVPGDADGSGRVTVTDIAVTIDLILSGAYDRRADVDGNGRVTVTDIAAIIDLVLLKPATGNQPEDETIEPQ